MKKILLVSFALLMFFSASLAYATSQGNSTHKPNIGAIKPELKLLTKDAKQNPKGPTTTVTGQIEVRVKNATKEQDKTPQGPKDDTKKVQDNDQDQDNSTPSRGSEVSAQRRSVVANAVQEMLSVADRVGGIGEQVREIARTQNDNQEKIEEGLTKIQSRSGLTKFFIGPKYNEIKKANELLNQNQEQVNKLNAIKDQLTSQEDKQKFEQQIQVLEQTITDIKTSLIQAEKGFSLFGWLFKK